MSTLAERLRGVLRPGAVAGAPQADGPAAAVIAVSEADSDRTSRSSGGAAMHDAAAGILGGEWREARGHRFLVVDRRYAPGHRHGHVAMADALPPSDGPWPRLSLLANDHCPGNLLFVDLETTGLAG